jgi:hypothetical protein
MTRFLTALAALFGIAAAAFAQDASRSEAQGPGSTRVFALAAPAVTGESYAITGRVAYEGVAGDGYLEMWSHFADGSRYFSRTLDARGLLAKLTGSSPERAFVLPFFLGEGGPRPTRLEVNVVLPGAGQVVVSGLRFVPDANEALAPGAWWSDRTGGLLGGAAGGAAGVLGGVIGVLGSLGRGRRFVLAGLLALGVSGLVCLAAGVTALALGQPYGVWYPLVLLGVIEPVIAFSLLPQVRRRYEALELRRMSALDARA